MDKGGLPCENGSCAADAAAQAQQDGHAEDQNNVLDENGSVDWMHVKVTVAAAFAKAAERVSEESRTAADLTAVAQLTSALLAVEEKTAKRPLGGLRSS